MDPIGKRILSFAGNPRAKKAQEAQKAQETRETLNTREVAKEKLNKPIRKTRTFNLTPTLVAHVLGGSEIKGLAGLECNTFSNSLEFGCHELKKAATGKYGCLSSAQKELKQMLTDQKKCLEWQKKYARLSTRDNVSDLKIRELTKSLHSEIQNLQVGESLLLPGGWCGRKKGKEVKYGHAMLYEITKSANDFSFTIYNTGKGLDKYHIKKEDGHYYTKSFQKIPESVLSESFLKKLVELRTKPDWVHEDKFPEQKLYKEALKPLKKYENRYLTLEIARPVQEAQTCTWDCQTLWQEKRLSAENYSLLSLCTKLYTAQKWKNNKKNISNADNITKHIETAFFRSLDTEKSSKRNIYEEIVREQQKKNSLRGRVSAFTAPSPKIASQNRLVMKSSASPEHKTTNHRTTKEVNPSQNNEKKKKSLRGRASAPTSPGTKTTSQNPSAMKSSASPEHKTTNHRTTKEVNPSQNNDLDFLLSLKYLKR